MFTPPTQNNPLVGIWKLISATAIHADGTIAANIYGANPIGYITYTVEGYMMVMFAKSGRPLLSQAIDSPLSKELEAVPLEELAQAFAGFSAYAGTYTLAGDTVRHHLDIASIPNRVGVTLIRTFAIDGNRITLRTPETISDGVAKVFELIWERV